MDWGNPEYRVAVLRLWAMRVLRRTRKLQPLTEHLLGLGWVTQSPRQSELTLNALGDSHLPNLLGRIWPDWRRTLQQLQDAGLPIDAKSLVELARSTSRARRLPGRLHHKTYAALAGMHSKSTGVGKVSRPGLTLTTDGVLRIRPNEGLMLCLGAKRLSCDDLTAVIDELILTERTLLDGIHPAGILPRAIMTVENLGAFMDMPKPRELLLIHQPGWNTLLSLQFIDILGSEAPWYHFGDLDPEGMAIHQHLNQKGRMADLFLPSFWEEYVEAHSRPLSDAWPETTVAAFSQPLLKQLFASRRWLEQEPIVLDERIEIELAGLVCNRA